MPVAYSACNRYGVGCAAPGGSYRSPRLFFRRSGGKTLALRRRQLDLSTFKAAHPSPCRHAGPPADVIDWRRCRLLEAGFPTALATVLGRTARSTAMSCCSLSTGAVRPIWLPGSWLPPGAGVIPTRPRPRAVPQVAVTPSHSVDPRAGWGHSSPASSRRPRHRLGPVGQHTTPRVAESVSLWRPRVSCRRFRLVSSVRQGVQEWLGSSSCTRTGPGSIGSA